MPVTSAANISKIRFAEQGGDPATPAANFWQLYVKNDGLYLIDDGGIVYGPFVESGDPGLHAIQHQSGGLDEIKLDNLGTPDDNTDLNASITRHGLLLKLDNNAGNFLNGQGAWAVPSPSSGEVGDIAIIIDGGGSAIAAGIKAAFRVDYACTINAWSLLSVDNIAGSIVIDIWKDTHANAPPDNADSITNGHEPQMAASVKAEDTDLSDWSDVTVDVGDWLVINVDSSATVTLISLVLKITRS